MSLSLRLLALLFGLGVAAGSALNLASVWAGGRELALPASFLALALVLVLPALYFARKVSRFARPATRAQAKNMTPLFAARILAYAQALALGGAGLTGWQLAVMVYQRGLLPVRGGPEMVWSLLGLLGSALLLGGGLLAEHWCKLPPEDKEGTGLGEPSVSS